MEERTDLTRKELEARGWSRNLIDRLLGEPDRLERNPIYPNAPATKLYDRARVENAEASEAFLNRKKRVTK